MSRACGVVALCALSLFARSPALAQPASAARLTLVQELCVTRSYDPAAFATLLQIELQSLGVALEQSASFEALGASDPGLAIVRIGCEAGEAQLRVELVDVLTSKHVLRDMSVGDIERSARPRALALSVTTTIESSWTELTMPHDTVNPTPLPDAVRLRLRQRLSTWLQPLDVRPRPAPVAPPQPAIERKNALAIGGAMRAFPARNTALIGPELTLSRAFAPLRLALSVEALFGSQELNDEAGRIGSYKLYWLTAGAMLLWTSKTRPELSIGPFGRLGYAAASGRSERSGYSAKHAGGVASAIGLAALLRAAISDQLAVSVGLDLGYVPNGVVFLADLARTAGMADVSVAVRAGVELAF